jgi:hypothetical protein
MKLRVYRRQMKNSKHSHQNALSINSLNLLQIPFKSWDVQTYKKQPKKQIQHKGCLLWVLNALYAATDTCIHSRLHYCSEMYVPSWRRQKESCGLKWILYTRCVCVCVCVYWDTVSMGSFQRAMYENVQMESTKSWVHLQSWSLPPPQPLEYWVNA